MADLIGKLRAQRESWHDLGDGKRVRIRRPVESEFGTLLRGILLEHVQKYVVDWEGITEADLLGPAVGASDPVPFSPEVWAEVISDKAEWVGSIAGRIAEVVSEYLDKRKAAQGN